VVQASGIDQLRLVLFHFEDGSLDLAQSKFLFFENEYPIGAKLAQFSPIPVALFKLLKTQAMGSMQP